MFSWSTVLFAASAAAAPIALLDIIRNWPQSPLAHYPTDFTRGIIPNDYWRDVPFYSAISFGVVSVEADVWLYNDTLFVGHEEGALTENRTFESLYVDPIVKTIEAQNPKTPFVKSTTKNGVFDADSGQTLYFWVDVKTDGETTWPAVVSALQPLRDRGYLTTVDGTTVTPGPVTVIGTGSTPLDQVRSATKRDYFYDGPLLSLEADDITASISPIASTDFGTAIGPVTSQGLNDTQLAALQEQVKTAEDLGIHVRYWDLPAWPISKRNKVWQQLMSNGVYLLNVDDLAAAAETEW